MGFDQVDKLIVVEVRRLFDFLQMIACRSLPELRGYFGENHYGDNQNGQQAYCDKEKAF
jgi:hypothetical protein